MCQLRGRNPDTNPQIFAGICGHFSGVSFTGILIGYTVTSQFEFLTRFVDHAANFFAAIADRSGFITMAACDIAADGTAENRANYCTHLLVMLAVANGIADCPTDDRCEN